MRLALPLAGVRVLDLSRVLAGPWATMTLADLGAEVWKIENVAGGDDTRAWSSPSYKGVSTYYLCANRGKKSVAVDLKSPQGRALVLELAAQADIVIENFSPGAVKRLGLDYETLRSSNRGLIYCSISGYGQEGPEAERPGYDFVLQAESGLMSVTGAPDGGPQRLGVAFIDVTAGMIATQSMLAALIQRRDTGEGQYIDVSLLESSLNMLVNLGSAHLNAGAPMQRYGNAHPTVVPYQVFETSDGEFALAVGNDKMFRAFCSDVVGRPELSADPRFVTAHVRALNRDALIPLLADILRGNTSAHWLAACRVARVPAGQLNSVAEALTAPGAVARGVVQHLHHPHLGEVKLVGPAHGLQAQKTHAPKPPPMLGEDTKAVLTDVLGYDAARIEQLCRDGVIACFDPGPPAA